METIKRWVVINDIHADPGGSMAVVQGDIYRSPCAASNPGVPIYSKNELEILKRVPKSASLFRFAQKVKRVFPAAYVVHSILNGSQEYADKKRHDEAQHR